MRRTARRANAPACGRRPHRRHARMGEQKAGGGALLRGQRQPPRGRQRDIINETGNQCQTLGFQAFFKHPQCILRRAGLDNQNIGRRQAERPQPMPVEKSVLGSGTARHAPQNRASDCSASASHQHQDKSPGRAPRGSPRRRRPCRPYHSCHHVVRSDRARIDVACRLDFMNAGIIQGQVREALPGRRGRHHRGRIGQRPGRRCGGAILRRPQACRMACRTASGETCRKKRGGRRRGGIVGKQYAAVLVCKPDCGDTGLIRQ